MFIFLLDNFTLFFKTTAIEPLNLRNIFEVDKYAACFKDERKEFMKHFVKTQGFSTFIERVHKSKLETNDTSYFIEGSSVYHSFGRVALDIHCKQFLYRAKNAYKNVTLDV